MCIIKNNNDFVSGEKKRSSNQHLVHSHPHSGEAQMRSLPVCNSLVHCKKKNLYICNIYPYPEKISLEPRVSAFLKKKPRLLKRKKNVHSSNPVRGDGANPSSHWARQEPATLELWPDHRWVTFTQTAVHTHIHTERVNSLSNLACFWTAGQNWNARPRPPPPQPPWPPDPFTHVFHNKFPHR